MSARRRAHVPLPGRWLMVLLFVSKDHQTQSALGVELVVNHDSAVCLGIKRPHHASNSSCLIPMHMGAVRRARRSCT